MKNSVIRQINISGKKMYKPPRAYPQQGGMGGGYFNISNKITEWTTRRPEPHKALRWALESEGREGTTQW